MTITYNANEIEITRTVNDFENGAWVGTHEETTVFPVLIKENAYTLYRIAEIRVR